MLQETMNRIENLLRASKDLSDAQKRELLALMKQLHAELSELEKVEREQAHSIAYFTKVMTHEFLRTKPDKELLAVAMQGVKTSIRKFEATHPNLTRIIQSICLTFGV